MGGAAVFGKILRFRLWRRGPKASILVILATAGLTGSFVVTDGPSGNGSDSQAQELRTPMPGIQEIASLPEPPAPAESLQALPVPADPAPAAVAPPPSPAPTPAPVAAVTTPPSTSVAVPPVESTKVQPDLRPLVASSAPLAASTPVRIDIAAVGITARIGPLGLNPDGTLEVPTDFARAGWYTGRPTPGEAGPAVIVAHRASRRGGPGAFWKLPDVQPGQQIVVTRADRRRVLFSVERIEQHRKDAFPTEAVYGPTDDTVLRVITCGGPFDPALGDHYRDNVIVFARMTGWA